MAAYRIGKTAGQPGSWGARDPLLYFAAVSAHRERPTGRLHSSDLRKQWAGRCTMRTTPCSPEGPATGCLASSRTKRV
jgi:hypothetical protein